MAGQVTIVLLALSTAFASLKLWKWRRNYQVMQHCGWPVFASPVHLFDPIWMALGPLFIPVFKLLPIAWTRPWLSVSNLFGIWKSGYQPFYEAGCDTFVLATPNGNVLWTSNGTVIQQLLTNHPQCQLAVDLVDLFKICGPNIGVTEGPEWKLYRKIVTSGLGHSINVRVWHESISQMEKLVTHWAKNERSLINNMDEWTSKLALHVLAHGFFDSSMDWNDSSDAVSVQTPGHSLTFDRALRTTVQNLTTILMTPQPLLHLLPFKAIKQSSIAFKEMTQYLDEMREEASSRIDTFVDKKDKTLLEAIVIAGADSDITGQSAISADGVRGNLFFTLMAGHHTVGSVTSFIFIFLALYPDVQERVQREIDQQFGDRPKTDWSVEHDFKSLQNGYLGAVQKEVAAMYNPVQFIPRVAAEELTIKDASNGIHVIPAGTLTLINMAAANRNASTWLRQPRNNNFSATQRAKLSNSPALYFNPERWLHHNSSGADPRENPDVKAHDSTTAFIFGQGPRSCPGRTFAQVEMTATMATFFKGYSLELVITDETLSQCNGDEELAFQQTQANVIEMLYDNIEFTMRLKVMRGLPIKVVPRASM